MTPEQADELETSREQWRYRRRFLTATLAGSGALFLVALVMDRGAAFGPLAGIATLAVTVYTGAATYQQTRTSGEGNAQH